MNDIDRHDEGDQRLDRNLQVVASHLEFPQELAARYRATIKAMKEDGTIQKIILKYTTLSQ